MLVSCQDSAQSDSCSHRAQALLLRLGRLLLLALLLGGGQALDGPQHGRRTGSCLVAAGCSPMLLPLLQCLYYWNGGLLQGPLLWRRSCCSAGCLDVLQRLARRRRCRSAWRQLVALRCAVRAAELCKWHVR